MVYFYPCSQVPAQLFVTYSTDKSGEAWHVSDIRVETGVERT